MNNIYTSSNGSAAVAVQVVSGKPSVLKYAPESLGAWENRDQYASLVKAAFRKAGFIVTKRGSIAK